MTVQRRYFGESQWEEIDEETARKVLGQNYADVEVALRDIAAGLVLLTPGAEYKRSEEK